MTEKEMIWLDERPTIRSFPAVMSFRRARPSETFSAVRETRSRSVPTWRLAAEARGRQLEILAYQLEKEERL
jgi:hypothetical protein